MSYGPSLGPKPATDKQLWKLEQMGINYPQNVTAKEAFDLINSAVNSQERGSFAKNTSTSPRPDNSNGMRVGMCMNNAVQLYIACHKEVDKDKSMMLWIGEVAKHLMTIAKTLEKE